jgi:cytochrome c oxidase assembly protein subunit 11
MTVVFFVDPAIMKDPEQDDLDAITLSYTMYPVRQPETAQPQSGLSVPLPRS